MSTHDAAAIDGSPILMTLLLSMDFDVERCFDVHQISKLHKSASTKKPFDAEAVFASIVLITSTICLVLVGLGSRKCFDVKHYRLFFCVSRMN